MTRSADMPGPRAELARFTAKLDAIFARGREEARNPTNPVLRAWNDLNFEAQKAGLLGIDLEDGMVAARARADRGVKGRRAA